jgi:ribose transport system permease protein
MPSLNRILTFIKEQILFFILLALIGAFSIFSDKFLSIANLISIIRQVAIFGIMSCGMTFVIISGNMDLTAGSVVSLTCCIAVRMHDEIGPALAIVIAISVGILSGLITGYLVGYLKLGGFITTLGMSSVLIAVTMIYTDSKFWFVKDPNNTWFRFIGRESILGIPAQIYIYLILILIFQFILSRTKYGHQLMAVGGNPLASLFAGIDDKRIILKAFVFSGLCASIAGVVYGSRGMSAQTGIGTGFEFEVLTAVILSGTSLLGGSGSVARALLGVLIMGVLRNGYVMMGLPYYTQWLTQSVIVIAVVWLDINSKRKVIK